jgi:hypothetical protein
MIGLLLALYPARWRVRYGEEFRAVLESRPLGPFDVADVLLGALDARLAFRSVGASSANGGHLTMLRLGAYGAIAGGILWAVGLAVSSSVPDGTSWLPVILVGTFALLLALTGLSAFQARREPRLAWAAFAIPALGAIASLVGLLGLMWVGDAPFIASATPWEVFALGLIAMVIGSALFAIATIRAAVLSRAAAIGLAISAVAMVIVTIGGIGFDPTGSARIVFVIPVIGFAGSWVALGANALRSGPIRAATAA